MLSHGEGIAYAPGSKRVVKSFSLPEGLTDPMASLPILLFLERMIPSGWGTAQFLQFSELTEQLENQLQDDGTLVYLQPNPWISIASNTWPFVIRSHKHQSIPLEVWPEQARHDSPRWIRSKDGTHPLGTFSIRLNKDKELSLFMEFHVNLAAPATNSIEDVERALAHQLREEQWDSDWKSMTGKDDEFSEQELALCAFQRALQVEEPTFLPNVTTQERAHYIRTILSRAPGIEHRHPVAANAIAQIEK